MSNSLTSSGKTEFQNFHKEFQNKSQNIQRESPKRGIISLRVSSSISTIDDVCQVLTPYF